MATINSCAAGKEATHQEPIETYIMITRPEIGFADRPNSRSLSQRQNIPNKGTFHYGVSFAYVPQAHCVLAMSTLGDKKCRS